MSDDGNVKQGPWSNPVNLPGLFDSSGKLGPLPQDSLPYVIEQARLQHLQIKRLTDQLRWRKCSEDGDPNEHGQYLTIVEGDRDMQNYNGLWDCHEYAATTHWLPIPPDTDQQDNERADV